MAGNYAALLPLARTLNEILELERCIDLLTKEKIASLHEKVGSIITFLEDNSNKHRGEHELARERVEIIEAANQVQDFMDSYLYSVLRTKYDSTSLEANKYWDKVIFDRVLNMAFERIHFICEKAMKKSKNISDTAKDLRSARSSYSSPVDEYSSSPVKVVVSNMFVGFEDELNTIKERIYEDSPSLRIISIVGTGGIGKTTLAKKAFDDSLLARYFDVCAWITVSQVYQRKEILSQLLQCFNNIQVFEENEAQLAKTVYQNLIRRRYLIVIDDIWSNEAWDDLKMIFPDDGNRSRILITTRLSDVAIHSGSTYASLHQMKFLNEDQSWKLLRERVFGPKSCPPRLMQIGKKIARNCGGLPLTVVVVAGLLLSSGDVTKEGSWEAVSENISLAEPAIALHCSKILYMSYDWLPLRLKPCFLYITAFPEDSEIDVSKLIKLWIAEGFLKPDNVRSKCLEDVGEMYLEEFVKRNLITVGEKGLDGKLKIVGVHDLLREICITKAGEERFLRPIYEMNVQKYTFENSSSNRRLSIRCDYLYFQELPALDSTVRSALFFPKGHLTSELSLSCWRLNILDAPNISWLNLSDVISAFVNLRYIAFPLSYSLHCHGFPTSITKLFNLQTIIVNTYFTKHLQVPYEILEMPKLRHFSIDSSFVLSHPTSSSRVVVQESDLQTLETVKDFQFTEEALKLLVNVKKLSLISELEWDWLNLDNIFHLKNLEELCIDVYNIYSPPRIWNYAFPISLRILSLKDVCLPWDNMTIIGSLPNLQVLTILHNRGAECSEWMPMEGQFLRLKYLCSTLDDLVNWEVEKEHFPSLESLRLMFVESIDEIPYGIGEIDTLRFIECYACKESVVNSAKRIEEQQHENGNNGFHVLVIPIGRIETPDATDIGPDDMSQVLAEEKNDRRDHMDRGSFRYAARGDLVKSGWTPRRKGVEKSWIGKSWIASQVSSRPEEMSREVCRLNDTITYEPIKAAANDT